jgi:hypothetical protein
VKYGEIAARQRTAVPGSISAGRPLYWPAVRLLSRRPIAGYAVAVIAGALGALPAEPAVKTSSPAGFSIENSEIVPVDAATAWQALVEDVDRWWPRDHTWWGPASKLSIEPRAGGCFCEIAGARQARHMAVVFVDPPILLRMAGGLGPIQGMGLHGALEWRLDAERSEQGREVVGEPVAVAVVGPGPDHRAGHLGHRLHGAPHGLEIRGLVILAEAHVAPGARDADRPELRHDDRTSCAIFEQRDYDCDRMGNLRAGGPS